MTRPVDESLWIVVDGFPRLVGSRCLHCATTTFPQQDSCPRCTESDMQARELPRTGRLWSFTVQGFQPKPPYNGVFSPYGVGYVDLGEVIVEARLTESDPSALVIGAEMTLVLEELRPGTQTFAFALTS